MTDGRVYAADVYVPDECCWEKHDGQRQCQSQCYLPSKIAKEEPHEESVKAGRHKDGYCSTHFPANNFEELRLSPSVFSG